MVEMPAWAAKFWYPSAEKEGPAAAAAALPFAVAAEVEGHFSRQSGQVLKSASTIGRFKSQRVSRISTG